ncbi:hypothetical protein [Serratia fonticola]|uniref:hypothetical protein n=1 Tax=Serratia fonticola TaxID=47917 RepID=UPI0013768CDE|nr:hypothetical protein [Serratia fonticola]NCG55123.1 hypothetical protein [Serratia fonticola]
MMVRIKMIPGYDLNHFPHYGVGYDKKPIAVHLALSTLQVAPLSPSDYRLVIPFRFSLISFVLDVGLTLRSGNYPLLIIVIFYCISSSVFFIVFNLII